MICPVCHGSKLRYNDETQSWGPESCIACKGSGMGPEGNQAAPATLEKLKASLREKPAETRANGRAPWTPAEDQKLIAEEERWRKSAKAKAGGHKPAGWYENVARALQAAYPDQPLRTRNAVKQRILRLLPSKECIEYDEAGQTKVMALPLDLSAQVRQSIADRQQAMPSTDTPMQSDHENADLQSPQ